ncbi:hypothetical protein D3C75_1075890 [compost metagenome]
MAFQVIRSRRRETGRHAKRIQREWFGTAGWRTQEGNGHGGRPEADCMYIQLIRHRLPGQSWTVKTLTGERGKYVRTILDL